MNIILEKVIKVTTTDAGKRTDTLLVMERNDGTIEVFIRHETVSADGASCSIRYTKSLFIYPE